MKVLTDQIFEYVCTENELVEFDKALEKECERYLRPYREKLPDAEYEEIRDIVFSISYISKRAAFEIGFSTAVRLKEECFVKSRL